MKKVLYYTSVSFLDIALEKINILKSSLRLSVLIEITPDSAIKINIDNLPANKVIIEVSKLLDKDNYKFFEPFLNGCENAYFYIHKSKTGFSLSTFHAFKKLQIIINNYNPDIIHIESLSLRALGLFPYLFSNKKIFITIHDSLPHFGEKNWKISLPRFLFLKIPYQREYFFYSEYSKNQFIQHYKNDQYPKKILKMYPYTFYNQFSDNEISVKSYFLFFGSISFYKGIDVLLSALPIVFEEFSEITLVIAGTGKYKLSLNDNPIVRFKKQIVFLDRYISNRELVGLIRRAKFVVCPYLDASQSGVLMTSFALNVPVIASNVGAFPEYIEHRVTGMLVPPNDPSRLAEAIKVVLNNKLYKEMKKNITERYSKNTWINNKDIFLSAYL